MYKTLNNSTGRRAVTLYGLNEISKTQLAIAHIKIYYNDYSAILWLNIKNEISVKQSYPQIIKRILREHLLASQLSAITDKNKLDKIVETVKRWLKYIENT